MVSSPGFAFEKRFVNSESVIRLYLQMRNGNRLMRSFKSNTKSTCFLLDESSEIAKSCAFVNGGILVEGAGRVRAGLLQGIQDFRTA